MFSTAHDVTDRRYRSKRHVKAPGSPVFFFLKVFPYMPLRFPGTYYETSCIFPLSMSLVTISIASTRCCDVLGWWLRPRCMGCRLEAGKTASLRKGVKGRC